ncbi:MAG: DUF1015 domain-containing protein [Thermodesulfobacteriota bacterium]|nr:DUF1015 domain-containing protein [Thermodesulfobacteriota bacterium]
MAIVMPFRGLTYNFNLLTDFDRLVAPPYDVISEEEQEAYHQAHPANVIRLILGKKKSGDSDWDNRYIRAADLFSRWQSDGTLIRADHPCIYLSSLEYDLKDGRGTRTRWGMGALVRIEDEGSSTILPHEQTFSAHKDDRLKLMRACKAQLSQIFGLYEDSDNAVLETLKKTITQPPPVAFDFADGTRHSMWILESRSLAEKIASAMSTKRIFIADGHHRYETARSFRNIMRTRYGARPSDRSYEYVMMYLTSMDDEGLTILPSHRLVREVPNFDLKSFLETLKTYFEIKELPVSHLGIPGDCATLRKVLEEMGEHSTAFAFYPQKQESIFLLRLRPTAIQEMDQELDPSLKSLDVVVLSRLILEKVLCLEKSLDNERLFHYESDMEESIAQVNSGDCQMAFLLNPTKIEQVKEIAAKSLYMPRKSTYFYPKVLTGLVFNKIDPHETIQIQ